MICYSLLLRFDTNGRSSAGSRKLKRKEKAVIVLQRFIHRDDSHIFECQQFGIKDLKLAVIFGYLFKLNPVISYP